MKMLACAALLSLGCLALSVQAEVQCSNQNDRLAPTTPMSEFALHEDGTTTHVTTGLVWMRCSLGQTWNGTTCTGSASTYTWQQALQAVADLNSGGGFAGHTDWRLPNKNELNSIVERKCYEPAINGAIFPATPADWYWSSSPYADDATGAWNVSFNGGCVLASPKTELDRVRLVREGR
ncbi:DUF1566 domain-containing protein [Thioalkalivibrio sulfidiphilus]|uniref:Lcl C-terminal domain-containing protein n=1 Tax=Thioalkalivibrio sulfidiphilus TaxID=1033854 RepID=UPI003B2AD731